MDYSLLIGIHDLNQGKEFSSNRIFHIVFIYLEAERQISIGDSNTSDSSSNDSMDQAGKGFRLKTETFSYPICKKSNTFR